MFASVCWLPLFCSPVVPSNAASKSNFMEYSKLIAVTGLSGLFELVSSKNDGAIVRGLQEKNVQFVSSRKHQFSHLESIEVYTHGENVNLVDVFQAMKAAGKALPDAKNAAAIKAYFEDVYPAMDFDRVYGSDMKKMVKWYALLTEAGIDPVLRAQEAPADSEAEATVTEQA